MTASIREEGIKSPTWEERGGGVPAQKMSTLVVTKKMILRPRLKKSGGRRVRHTDRGSLLKNEIVRNSKKKTACAKGLPRRHEEIRKKQGSGRRGSGMEGRAYAPQGNTKEGQREELPVAKVVIVGKERGNSRGSGAANFDRTGTNKQKRNGGGKIHLVQKKGIAGKEP